MAFDQSTRNRLQRFVTDARRTLEEEFTRQLQNDYGLDPISGTASPLESLRHINDQQRETARILRDTLAHYCASADTDTKAGLDRIVLDDAHVGEPLCIDLLEQAADAGGMHFDAEVIVLRVRRGDAGGRFAHAETDL